LEELRKGFWGSQIKRFWIGGFPKKGGIRWLRKGNYLPYFRNPLKNWEGFRNYSWFKEKELNQKTKEGKRKEGLPF